MSIATPSWNTFARERRSDFRRSRPGQTGNTSGERKTTTRFDCHTAPMTDICSTGLSRRTQAIPARSMAADAKLSHISAGQRSLPFTSCKIFRLSKPTATAISISWHITIMVAGANRLSWKLVIYAKLRNTMPMLLGTRGLSAGFRTRLPMRPERLDPAASHLASKKRMILETLSFLTEAVS